MHSHASVAVPALRTCQLSVAFAVKSISPAICVNTSHKMLPTFCLWLVLILLPCSLHEWDKHLKELRKWKSIHEPDGNDRLSA